MVKYQINMEVMKVSQTFSKDSNWHQSVFYMRVLWLIISLNSSFVLEQLSRVSSLHYWLRGMGCSTRKNGLRLRNVFVPLHRIRVSGEYRPSVEHRPSCTRELRARCTRVWLGFGHLLVIRPDYALGILSMVSNGERTGSGTRIYREIAEIKILS